MTEDLDIEQPAALLAYLRRAGHITPSETPEIRVLAGGVSNRTVLVERSGGEAWVLKQALAKLRVPNDWFSSPERIHREALGLRFLPQLAPAGTITPLVFEDHAQHLLAMQAVPQPHHNWKALLLAGSLDLSHVEQFGRLLGLIHRNSAQRRPELEPVFGDRSFFETLRLDPYYRFAAGQVPAAAPFLENLIQETLAVRMTLVHGDYSPKNILVHEGKLVLLDHEVIHFGDGAFDLGFSLTHLLSKAHHFRHRRGDFAEAARHYWQVYYSELGSRGWGQEFEQRAVRHTLACLLARVAGKSPLEYLDAGERQEQQRVVVGLMGNAPASIPELIEQFVRGLNRC
jgi:5-methylthioribose kinase